MDDHSEEWDLLVAGIRQGDEAAAREVANQLYPRVIGVVRAHLPSREEPVDLAQEVFMRVFSRIDQFRRDQPVVHWVVRIARNACYDELRKQRVRPEVRFADLSEHQARYVDTALRDGMAPVSAVAEGMESMEVVERLLSMLGAREQMVIRMLDVDERSVKEIAEETGWSLSKIKVTAHRARKKLRDRLTKWKNELT